MDEERLQKIINQFHAIRFTHENINKAVMQLAQASETSAVLVKEFAAIANGMEKHNGRPKNRNH